LEKTCQEYHGGAVFRSQHKVREARTREAIWQGDEIERKLQKARAKKEREESQFQRQIELEQRHVERERLKKERADEQAAEAGE
jgi:hypothetical protein